MFIVLWNLSEYHFTCKCLFETSRTIHSVEYSVEYTDGMIVIYVYLRVLSDFTGFLWFTIHKSTVWQQLNEKRVTWGKTPILIIQTHILLTNGLNSLKFIHDQTHLEFLSYI